MVLHFSGHESLEFILCAIIIFVQFNTFSLPNDNPLGRDGDHLFIAGDVRCNVQPGLMALHTLFIREHNRLCRKYRASHSNVSM